MHGIMTAPDDHQLAALGAAFDVFTRRYKLADACGAEKPLNELDKQVLLFVSEHADCGPTDVARFLGVPNTTISSATDRLAKAGLLERHRPEQDRRAVALRLSPSGAERASGFVAAHQALYARMLAPLTRTERERFIELITKIVYYDD
jgi:DNA-binding MarR family transcriptional regulator